MAKTLDAATSYRKQGYYLHCEPVLTPNEIAAAVAGMEAVRDGVYETGMPPEDSQWSPGDDPHKLVKVEMPQQCNRAIMAAVANPRLGAIAADLTGASMVQAWWVQLLMKPSLAPDSGFSANVGWHQDRQYWVAWEPGSELFTAWLALSDVTEEAGAMHFVPESHTWGLLDQGDFHAQELDGQIAVPEGKIWREVSGALPPGGVSFHDCLTLHASGPNRSGRPRMSLAIHLRTEKSTPKDGVPQGLSRHIEDRSRCPVLWAR